MVSRRAERMISQLAVARERPGTPGPHNSREARRHAAAASAAELRACRGRRDPCGQRDAQLAGPMFHRSGLVRPYVPSVRPAPVRPAPVRAGPGRGGPGPGRAGRERANAFSRSPLVPGMVTGAAVGASDHRLIVASMVSRRCTQAISHLACGTGVHHVRTVPVQGRDPSAAVSGVYLGFCTVCRDTA